MLNFYFQIWKSSTLLRKPADERKGIHILLPHLLGIQAKKEKERKKGPGWCCWSLASMKFISLMMLGCPFSSSRGKHFREGLRSFLHQAGVGIGFGNFLLINSVILLGILLVGQTKAWNGRFSYDIRLRLCSCPADSMWAFSVSCSFSPVSFFFFLSLITYLALPYSFPQFLPFSLFFLWLSLCLTLLLFLHVLLALVGFCLCKCNLLTWKFEMVFNF